MSSCYGEQQNFVLVLQNAEEKLKILVEEAKINLDLTKNYLHICIICYQICDEAYEWALGCLKFVSTMKKALHTTPTMIKNAQPAVINNAPGADWEVNKLENLVKFKEKLDKYLLENPKNNKRKLDRMKTIAEEIADDRLILQCQAVEVRCHETEKTLLEQQFHLDHIFSESKKNKADQNFSMDRQSPSQLPCTSPDYFAGIRRRSFAGSNSTSALRDIAKMCNGKHAKQRRSLVCLIEENEQVQKEDQEKDPIFQEDDWDTVENDNLRHKIVERRQLLQKFDIVCKNSKKDGTEYDERQEFLDSDPNSKRNSYLHKQIFDEAQNMQMSRAIKDSHFYMLPNSLAMTSSNAHHHMSLETLESSDDRSLRSLDSYSSRSSTRPSYPRHHRPSHSTVVDLAPPPFAAPPAPPFAVPSASSFAAPSAPTTSSSTTMAPLAHADHRRLRAPTALWSASAAESLAETTIVTSSNRGPSEPPMTSRRTMTSSPSRFPLRSTSSSSSMTSSNDVTTSMFDVQDRSTSSNGHSAPAGFNRSTTESANVVASLDEHGRKRLATPPPGAPPSVRMQYNVVNELLQTEIAYVRSLHYIIENYIPEMQQQPQLPNHLTGKRSVIFGNVEKIYEFHVANFLPDLMRYCLKSSESLGSHVSKCFLRHKAKFHLYALYSKNKPKSDALMAEYGSNYFKKKQLVLNDKMDLSSYLLKPVQRIGKYTLMMQNLVKACPVDDQEQMEALKSVEDMLIFQLRHGNDLLAMDSVQNCDLSLKEQGQLLRQDELVIFESRSSKKCLRRVFLFENLVLFAKPRRQKRSNHHHHGHLRCSDVYEYKYSIMMTDVGLTETVADSELKFELWFRRHTSNAVFVILAPSLSVKNAWIEDLARLLWYQAIKNREDRLSEMTSMGIGSKVCLDLKDSQDRIQNRSVDNGFLIKASKSRCSLPSAADVRRFNNWASSNPANRSGGGCGDRPRSLVSVQSSGSGDGRGGGSGSTSSSTAASSTNGAGGGCRQAASASSATGSSATPMSSESGFGDLVTLEEYPDDKKNVLIMPKILLV